MSVQSKQVEITSPCPITLDRSGVAANDRELFCGHCSKEVHLLSHMSESEARTFMAERAGDDICVSYAIKPDGSVRFRPEPPPLIPVSALTRPLQRLTVAASIGAAWLGLTGCTPHTDERDRAEEREQVAKPEPMPEELVAGGMVAEPIPEQPVGEQQPCDSDGQHEDDVMVDGGLKAEPIDAPPVEPVGEVQPLQQPPDIVAAGGLRAEPLPHQPMPVPVPRGALEQDP